LITIKFREGYGGNKGNWELVNEWGVTKAFFYTKAQAVRYLMKLGGVPEADIDIPKEKAK
jgi:hypothetical protein